MKIVQYTVNIGEYDPPRKDLLSLDDYDLFRNDARNSRAAKILSHKFIDADVSIYWDASRANVTGLSSEGLVSKYLGDYDIAAMKCSTGKDCVYQEIEGAKMRVKHDSEKRILDQQAEHYRKIGVPEHLGNLAGFQPLIRKHNKKMQAFNNDWWAEICRWSYRDQVSFPVMLWMHPEINVNWVNFDGVCGKLSAHGNKIPKMR